MAINRTEMQIQFIRMHNPISSALVLMPLDTHFISGIFRLNYTFLRTRRMQLIFIFNCGIQLHELTERHEFFFNLTKIFISIFGAGKK